MGLGWRPLDHLSRAALLYLLKPLAEAKERGVLLIICLYTPLLYCCFYTTRLPSVHILTDRR